MVAGRGSSVHASRAPRHAERRNRHGNTAAIGRPGQPAPNVHVATLAAITASPSCTSFREQAQARVTSPRRDGHSRRRHGRLGGIHVAAMSMLSDGDSGGCAGFRTGAGRHGRHGGEHQQRCLDQRHSCLGCGTDHRQAQCTGQRIAELVEAARQQRHCAAVSGCQQHCERGRVDGRYLPRPPALARRHRRHVERLAAGTSSAAAFGHGFLSVVACRRQPAALALAMYSRTCCSSTGIGTEPWLSTASWKARMSNLGPSACSASARRRWMVSSPSM